MSRASCPARRWLSGLAACALACTPEPADTEPADTDDTEVVARELGAAILPRSSRSLIDHDVWVKVAATDDPFASERPPVVYCDPPAWVVVPEDDHLDVYTELCNYLMLVQPTLADVYAGDTLSFLVDVQPLIPAEPAVAHFALVLGDEVIWEQTLDVPSINQLYRVSLTAPSDAPLGTPLAIHFHNHGVNSWQLYSVKVGDSPLEP